MRATPAERSPGTRPRHARARACGRGTRRSRRGGSRRSARTAGRSLHPSSLERPRPPKCETGGVKIAVVGHVEWVEFARVERVPERGEIVHATELWEEAAGGGAVAACELARLGA